MSDLARQTREQQARGKSIQQMLTPGAQDALRAALSDRIGPERFMQAAITSFQSSAGLRRCTEDSILGALFIAAQLGLEIGGPRGLAYLVPYRVKGADQATFVLGYRGLIELFYRTGQVSKVGAFLIRERDLYEERWDPQVGETFDFKKATGDRGEKVGAIAYAITRLGGPPIWVHRDRDQILKRRPPKWTGGPWETWEEEMWLKTAVKGLAPWVRQSTDDRSLEAAIGADETIRHGLPAPGETVQHAIERPSLAPPHAPRPPLAEPGKATRTPAETMQQMAEGTFPPPPPEDDEEALFEAQSAEEFNRYQDEQGPV